MAIKAEMKTNLNWLNDAIVVMEEIPEIIAIAGDEALAEIEEPFLRELQEEPRRSTGVAPNWTSEKQRMAYFASNGFGAGIPYERKGKLAASWKMSGKLIGRTWELLVENPATAARFVYGSLALSNLARAARFQQKFHAVTGWRLAAPIVVKWYNIYQEKFQNNMNKLIGELGTPAFRQRGITPRLPKKRRV